MNSRNSTAKPCVNENWAQIIKNKFQAKLEGTYFVLFRFIANLLRVFADFYRIIQIFFRFIALFVKECSREVFEYFKHLDYISANKKSCVLIACVIRLLYCLLSLKGRCRAFKSF